MAPSWHNGGIILALSWHYPGTLLLCMSRARMGTVVLVLGPCPHGTRDGTSRKHCPRLCWAEVSRHTKLYHLLPLCARPCCDTSILYHAIPCHITQFHPAPHTATPQWPCYAMPNCLFPSRTPYHTVPCRAVPCSAVLCHSMPCHTVPCRAVQCHSIPCSAVRCSRWRPSSGAGTGAGVAHPALPSAQAQTRPCPGAAQPAAAAGGSGKGFSNPAGTPRTSALPLAAQSDVERVGEPEAWPGDGAGKAV